MRQGDGEKAGGPERWVRRLEELTNTDVGVVGGKNASLGEMIGTLTEEGVRVPSGFATTAAAYWRFVDENGLSDDLRQALAELGAGRGVGSVGERIREAFLAGEIPTEVAEAIRSAYAALSAGYGEEATDVAVRSSATAEDLPEASFAGQQESYLNVRGEEALLDACRRCYASLFTDRAIAYREEKGFDHMEIALSVGVQKMVRSDRGAAGVMFTLDTETGFPDVVLIDGAWGLGEAVVQGLVNPDRFLVFTPLLRHDGVAPIVEKRLGDKARKVVYREDSRRGVREIDVPREERDRFVLEEDEILRLARWGTVIEAHYGRPMDIEWAKDGVSGDLFIVQARPETVESAKAGARLKTYTLKGRGEVLVRGAAIGGAVAAGRAVRLDSPAQADGIEEGAVLVTGRTDPDWGPILERVGAIVTDRGGRTSHAAIVSRELGIPAVVGAGNATETIEDGAEVTVSCAEGAEGRVYAGTLAYEEEEIDVGGLPSVETPVTMIVADPATAFRWWRLPVRGIGLARVEFIIADLIGIHPLALTRFEELEDDAIREEIRDRLRGAEPQALFVETLAREVARIAASRYPDPVIVRTTFAGRPRKPTRCWRSWRRRGSGGVRTIYGST